MHPERFPDRHRRSTPSPATIAVSGLVGRPGRFTVDDLIDLAAQPTGASATAVRTNRVMVSLTDLMSNVMLQQRAELLVATDLSGRSLVLPLRDLLARQTAQLVVESVPGRAAASDDGLARLDVEGWTYETEPLWVDELRAITFDDFVKRPRTMTVPWQHESIPDHSPDPTALMERVQHGDRAAFSDLYDALAPQVFGVIKRVLRDPAMSEEVTQEVFVEVWTTAARFDSSRAKVSTWVITMARRRAVDRVRREQSQRNRLAELQQQPIDTPVQPDAIVASSLDSAAVSSALGQLPADQRDVIQLAFIDGLAHGAIAERLGIPLGTVKGRIRGGLKRLRSIMDVEEIGALG